MAGVQFHWHAVGMRMQDFGHGRYHIRDGNENTGFRHDLRNMVPAAGAELYDIHDQRHSPPADQEVLAFAFFPGFLEPAIHFLFQDIDQQQQEVGKRHSSRDLISINLDKVDDAHAQLNHCPNANEPVEDIRPGRFRN